MPPRPPSFDLDALLDETSVWIFDLDNTLYPATLGISDEMHRRTTLFISKLLGVDENAAAQLRRSYQKTYGTALRGLAVHHGVEPGPFIEFVHDVNLTCLESAPRIAPLIAKLPGRRFVHTNAPGRHAQAVIKRLELEKLIDGILDVEAVDYVPKPDPQSYARLISTFGINPVHACMFEDQAPNLKIPAELGMRTVLIAAGHGTSNGGGGHHVTTGLAEFLSCLLGPRALV